MKVAIMQPYLFPYIGYFQLIYSVDTFIFYDNVQYIQGGWINRNRISSKNGEHLFTFSIQDDHYQKKISERKFTEKFEFEQRKFEKTINAAYRRAPYYEEVVELLRKIFEFDHSCLSDFISVQIELISRHLNITPTFLKASDMMEENEDDNTQAQERVIHLCKKAGGDTYINLYGGRSLYSKSSFLNQELELLFLKPELNPYPQFHSTFIPSLSIIDVLMFNSKDQIAEMLKEFDLE